MYQNRYPSTKDRILIVKKRTPTAENTHNHNDNHRGGVEIKKTNQGHLNTDFLLYKISKSLRKITRNSRNRPSNRRQITKNHQSGIFGAFGHGSAHK